MFRTAAGVCWLVVSAAILSCPFCAKLGPTLSDRIAEVDWVGVGTPADGGIGIKLEAVVRSAEGAPTAGIVRLSKSIGNGKERKLVFGRFNAKSGELRLVRVQSAGTRTAEYLIGASTTKSRSERIAHFVKHLDDADPDVRDDAYKAISKFYVAELADHSSSLDAAKMRRLIADPGQPATRIGLFGLLLGMAGEPEDAKRLAELAKSRDPRAMAGRDGFLAGLALLDRAKAEEIAIRQLADASEPHSGRQAALNAIQFIIDELPRRDPTPLLEGMTAALAIADLRDAVIDALRLQNASFAAPAIFDLADAAKPSRASVKFALSSPHSTATAFLAKAKERDPQLVRACQSDLAIETRTKIEPAPRIRERQPKGR